MYKLNTIVGSNNFSAQFIKIISHLNFIMQMHIGNQMHFTITFKIEKTTSHIRSYMSAHVLLNLLNKFGKRDKRQGLSIN